MANNRMWLVAPDGSKILLAKYYPNTGWYIFHEREKLDDFFNADKNRTLFGSVKYALEFEIIETRLDRLRRAWRRFKRRSWKQMRGKTATIKRDE